MSRFKKATKYNSFLKLGIAGPPGSGKSYSALSIATHLSEKRIAVIDAEAGSASKYADLFDFDSNEIMIDEKGRDVPKPFSPQRYMELIKDAYESGEYDVLIIDGITPEWNDAGGCLQWVDQITKGSDTRAAWKVVKPVHQDFINTILRVRMHVIVTMLAKKETIPSKRENGQMIPQKVTLDPVQQDDVPRVFDVFALMQNKEMIIDKTRCPGVDDQTFYKPGKEVADILREWLKGDPMPERPDYITDATGTHQEAQQEAQPAFVPTNKAIYNKGTVKGLWSDTDGYLAWASKRLNVEVTRQTVLTNDQKIYLYEMVDTAQAELPQAS